MAKQQELKEHRNYLVNPRRATEFDLDHRNDVGDFEPTLTKQADAEAADINNIMARFERTGSLPDMIRSEPQYGDFSDVGSYQEALNIVQFAGEQFRALDAKIRARFENDPAKFLEFCNNPQNAQEMIDLGLAQKREPKAPVVPPDRQAEPVPKNKGKNQSPPKELQDE